MVFDKGVDWRANRVLLAERFHWTLEYVDSIPDDELAELFGVLDGKAKAEAQIMKRRK